MPATCREQILVAVAAKLSVIVLTGLVVERERDAPVGESELPFLALYDDGEEAQDDFSGERGYTLRAAVEGLRAGASDLAARQAADELRGLAAKALFADPTLGGLARDLRLAVEPSPPRLDWEAPAAVGGFVLTVEIEYATREDDPFAFA